MKGLYLLTGVSDFDKFGKRWERQRENWAYRCLAMILKLIDRMRYNIG